MGEDATPRFLGGAARRGEILRRLQGTGFLSVTSLTHELGVSDMTIRRDLRRLAEGGQVRVVHGGASLPDGALRTADFASRGNREARAKKAIARRAVDLVTAGSTIAVDAGTTPFELAAALPAGFEGTVITHSIPVLQHLLHLPTARVIGLGGELLDDSQALIGAMTVEAMAGLHAETVFLGAAAVGPRGLFIAADLERHTKRTLMTIADRVVLLADHTKFASSAPVLLAPLDCLDVLVTDAALAPAMAEALADAGVEVLHPAADDVFARTSRGPARRRTGNGPPSSSA